MSSSMRSVELPDGSSFEFWMTPLTIAERTRAQKQSKTDDATDFALQLLVSKAKDQDGRALFNVGEIAELRHELPASVVEALMLQLIGETTEEEEEVDYKSSKKTLSKDHQLMAELAVAERLGKTLNQLREVMTAEELLLWMLYFDVKQDREQRH